MHTVSEAFLVLETHQLTKSNKYIRTKSEIIKMPSNSCVYTIHNNACDKATGLHPLHQPRTSTGLALVDPTCCYELNSNDQMTTTELRTT